MPNKRKIISVIISAAAVIITIIIAVGIGSVFIPPGQIINVFTNRFFDIPLSGEISKNTSNIILSLRLPRVLLAFLVGAALSCCGAAVQSVLKNPLASPFTLGVSSGASLGAGIVIASGASFLGGFTLAFAGLSAGILTMLFMVAFSACLDKNMQSNTVILTGMVFSLFINAIVTLMANMAGEKYKQIMKWQTGSFSGRNWDYVKIMAAVLLICTIIFILESRELDGMTFGDEQAQSVGINVKRVKVLILITAAVLSGTAVAFSGVIGFIDLIAPHIARRIFGAKHKTLLPMSAVLGGIFTVLCDLAARTLISPNELPVGVVTALAGAPFFAYVFFRKQKRRN